MTRISRGLAAVAVAAGLALAPAVSASASVTHYSSCAAVHRHYSGGIARAGVKYNVIHHANGTVTRVLLKGHVLHSTATYNANRGLDRDRDGVACEKS